MEPKADGPALLMPDVNKVVQWAGGGYDGCIWEPNTGFFDGEGKWHPVISTGHGKRDTLDVFMASRLPEFAAEALTDANSRRACSEFDLVCGITQEGLLAFQQNIRSDFFMETIKVLEEHGYAVFWKCSVCGEVIESFGEFAEHAGYRGDGGIGLIHEGPVCSTCHGKGYCHACGEYVGEDDIVCTDSGQYCVWCIEKEADKPCNARLRMQLDRIDADVERFDAQLEEYCRLVPLAAEKARAEAAIASRDLQDEKSEIVDKLMKGR